MVISISPSQYENWKKLAELLSTFKTDAANNASVLMNKMIGNLAANQYAAYRHNATEFQEILLSFEPNQKAVVNKLLYSLGTSLHQHS